MIKLLRDHSEDNPEPYILPGLCLEVLYIMYGVTTHKDCKRIISDEFPDDILERCIKYCKEQLEDNDCTGKRIKALNHEIYIFSRGKEGYKTLMDNV